MGKLVVIPTPIGNLEDITLRAIRYLNECDFILAEDTRVTKKLLNHLSFSKQVFSLAISTFNSNHEQIKEQFLAH